MSQASEWAANVVRWQDDSAKFAYEALGIKSLDPGQLKLLKYFDAPCEECPRIAAQASSGTGKTFTEAIMIMHFLTCRGDEKDHPKGFATAISWPNLMSNAWTELAKLIKNSPLMSSMFIHQTQKIVNKRHPDTWYFDARGWDSSAKGGVTEALGLAGHHAKYSFVVIDESSGVSKAVMNSAERTLGTVEDGGWAKIMQGGNPTHSTGPLWDAANSQRSMWNGGDGPVLMTGDPDDPARSPRVKLEWARNLVTTLGRNNAYVQVYVLAQFPDQAFNSLLSPVQVEEAMSRDIPPHAYNFQKMKIMADIAFEGDDRTVIGARQGLKCFEPHILRVNPNSSTMSRDIAGAIYEYDKKYQGDQIFVDATGGYGYGVMEALGSMGKRSIGVKFSESAMNPMFANKRAEMWWLFAQRVKNGLCLPRVEGLSEELTAVTHTLTKNGKILMALKELVKTILGRSPDIADMYVMGEYSPDSPKEFANEGVIKVKTSLGVNPLGKYGARR
jgi:hypothetical protein